MAKPTVAHLLRIFRADLYRAGHHRSPRLIDTLLRADLAFEERRAALLDLIASPKITPKVAHDLKEWFLDEGTLALDRQLARDGFEAEGRAIPSPATTDQEATQ